jgi:hypothetical protein
MDVTANQKIKTKMTIDEIKEFLKNSFRCEIIEETESKVVFERRGENKFELDKEYYEQVRINLEENLTVNETELFNGKSFEIVVKENSRLYSPRRNRGNEIIDTVNGFKYSYDYPSDEYILLLTKQIQETDNRNLRRYFDPSRYWRYGRRPNEPQSEEQMELFNPTVFEVLKRSLLGIETVKIKSSNEIRKNRFEQHMYSYLFSLSYNLSLAIYPLRFFDELFSPLRVGRLRRASVEEIEPPRRAYINDLILHYQKGISSESLDHQFLSFYHILEHFFEKIYNEDLVNKLRDELTQPGFSYKRKVDIEKLIKIIERRLKYKNDEFQINELEALELVLRKYVTEVSEIIDELNSVDSNLIEFFKTTEVPFSKGNKVNFEVESEVFKNLSKRIYFTRNSIVHSKETEKNKYIPFKDDKDLINEIYLMRIISEKVIINNSKEI